jgi:RNA polymerase primary sigma factor
MAILTREMELELVVRAQAGEQEAKDILVSSNLPLVKTVVRRYKDAGLPWEDLVQEGVLGLLRAIEEFDTTSGNKLSTYATYRIKQVAIRALENNGRVVRIPIYKQNQMAKVRKADATLTQTLGRKPSIDEIAKFLEISVADVKECKKLSQATQSLDMSVGEEEDTTLLDLLPEDKDNDVLEQQFLTEAVIDAIQSVRASDRNKEIIKLRFGIGKERRFTLEEIGNMYNFTKERCRQIEVEMLGKLQRVRALKELRGF